MPWPVFTELCTLGSGSAFNWCNVRQPIRVNVLFSQPIRRGTNPDQTRQGFPALGTRSHVFSRLAPVPCFPSLGSGYMFSCAWHRLHVFPPGSGSLFSRAWHLLHVFPPGSGYMFSRAWYRLHVFERLAQVLGDMISRALHL